MGDRVEIKQDDRLVERYLGELEGKNKKEYNVKEYWNITKNINDNGVEPIKDVIERTEAFLSYLRDNYDKDDKILIVSHNAVIKAIINILDNKNYKDKLEIYSIPNSCLKECEM